MPISKIKTSSITADAASVNLNIDANTLFLDVANNTVGIRTTSPLYPLQVGDYTNSATTVLAIAGTVEGRLNFGDGTSGVQANAGRISYWHATDHMAFYTAVNEAMRIDSSGNVGINNTSPSTFGKVTIQVAGTTTPTNATNVGPSSINLYNGGSGGATDSTMGIFGWQAVNPGIGSGIGFSRESDSNWGSQIRFYTHPPDVANIGNITERMRIASNGNVGIGGTNTAAGKLVVDTSGAQYGVDFATALFRESATRSTVRIRTLVDDSAELAFDVNGALRWMWSTRGSGEGYNFNLYRQSSSPNYTSVLGEIISFQQNGVINLPLGQLKFPSSQNASSDANTLDDYEEGTWTPVLKLGASNQTLTGTNAKYTKVGNIVNFSAELYFTKVGTGDFSVTAMPFVSAAIRQCNVNYYFQFYTSSMPSTHKLTYMESSGTAFAPQYMPAGGTQTANINDTHFTGSTNYFYFAGSYIVA